jgi:hypothetical protein
VKFSIRAVCSETLPLMKKSISLLEVEHTRITTPHVHAPQLKRVVDALLALEKDPSDRRAKVTAALLDKQGALDCPACGKRLDVSGYRVTRTHYGARESIACRGCRTGFVVVETQIV